MIQVRIATLNDLEDVIGVTLHAHQLKKNKHPQNQKEMTFPNN